MQIPVMRRGGGIIEANTNFRTVQDTTFSYTGDYVVIEDTATTWRIKFLTSGILTFYDNDIVIDIFGVGGGGAGAGYNSAASCWWSCLTACPRWCGSMTSWYPCLPAASYRPKSRS